MSTMLGKGLYPTATFICSQEQETSISYLMIYFPNLFVPGTTPLVTSFTSRSKYPVQKVHIFTIGVWQAFVREVLPLKQPLILMLSLHGTQSCCHWCSNSALAPTPYPTSGLRFPLVNRPCPTTVSASSPSYAPGVRFVLQYQLLRSHSHQPLRRQWQSTRQCSPLAGADEAYGCAAGAVEVIGRSIVIPAPYTSSLKERSSYYCARKRISYVDVCLCLWFRSPRR
jgi:hypothetical protein